MTTTEPLIEHHVLEYPGGYTRSVGPGAVALLHRAAAGRIVGVRTADGRVMVPPTEYDPETGADARRVRRGRSRPAWSRRGRGWPSRSPGKHHLTKPFAFALVRPDGADVPMVHVVDVAAADEMSVGMRVMPRWAAERVGYVTDLEAWVPMADGEQPTGAGRRRRGRAGDGHHGADPARVRDQRRPRAEQVPARHRRGQAHRPEGGRLRQGVPAAARLGPDHRRADRDRGRGLPERDRHHVLRDQHPGPVGERARGAVRVGADPARRRRHAVPRSRAGRRRRRRSAWACGCRRSGTRTCGPTPGA